ncbi:hypothetical protein OMK64_06430 [Cellulomonas fimi]|uniref:hypothetical protein n=1 Tax=Cellulomonas fimi TaxID=1708 RepID=UPI00234D51A0|nr:hypothetical protein [Cellulomonas fimi]MDC7121168.1 hypothetical protein [Cellulomonas fimi]
MSPVVAGRRRWPVYTAWGLLLVGLLAAMIVGFSNRQTNKDVSEADAKAAELVAAFDAAGLVPLDQDVVADVLGSDGGIVCTDPEGALAIAARRTGLENGAAGPGVRASAFPENLLTAGRLVLETYCPDVVDDYDDFVGSLELHDGTTTGG